MGGVAKAFKSITKVINPILSVAKFIPGVGQIAGVVQAGLNIATNIKDIFKQGFPKGLLTAAKVAAQNFLPGPMKAVTDFIDNKAGVLKDVLPAAVKNFIPDNVGATVVNKMDKVLA